MSSGYDNEKDNSYVDIFFLGQKGGSGGMKGTDGYDHIGMIDASGGVLDQDYEMFELQTPHVLLKHEYLCDSAGAGEWRGGLGTETVYKVGSEDTQIVTFGDGDFMPAFGLFGGGDGTLNEISITKPNGVKIVPNNKDIIQCIPKGSMYHQIAGGGGGYGNPKKRNRDALAEEVLDGVVSREAAQAIYDLDQAKYGL
ncbi:MAG: hydantoinase B/oxoprolinase family protein [Fimbriimonadaceae bacterium]|nr:hydantoinase B/oxoprolinase family protein [Alphaproteobacteria bacterium]